MYFFILSRFFSMRIDNAVRCCQFEFSTYFEAGNISSMTSSVWVLMYRFPSSLIPCVIFSVRETVPVIDLVISVFCVRSNILLNNIIYPFLILRMNIGIAKWQYRYEFKHQNFALFWSSRYDPQ